LYLIIPQSLPRRSDFAQAGAFRNEIALTFVVGQRNIMNDNVERRGFYGGRSEELTSSS
jgi:hypothetical protein